MLRVASVFVLLGVPLFALAESKATLTIATGDSAGQYYSTGGAICNNANLPQGIHCQVQATGGSIDNISALRSKQVDFAIAQADVIYSAIRGEAPFKEKATELRFLRSLLPEMVTLVVLSSSSIRSLRDIVGKRINIGNPGSGQFQTASDLLEACHIKSTDLALAGSMKISEMPDALKSNRLEGFFYVVAHPALNLKDLAHDLPVRFIPLADPCTDKFLSTRPYLNRTAIPAKTYQGLERDVPTIGLEAFLITRSDVSSIWVNAVSNSINGTSHVPSFIPPYSSLTQP